MIHVSEAGDDTKQSAIRQPKLTADEKLEKSESSRLQPTPSVARALYLKSGNRCAFTGCTNWLINMHGAFIGEIAHIFAASDFGPRGVKGMSDEARRAEENLILLCRNCHRTIDTKVSQFPADTVTAMKNAHEALIQKGAEQLFATGVEDITKSTGWISAENLAALPGDLDKMNSDEQEWNLKVVNNLARRLARVPRPARQLLAQIMVRGTLTQVGAAEVHADAEVIRRTTGRDNAPISEQELVGLVTLLEHERLAWFDEGDTGRYLIEVGRSGLDESDADTGWRLLEEIWVAAEDRSTNSGPDPDFIETLFVELDFSVLDG